MDKVMAISPESEHIVDSYAMTCSQIKKKRCIVIFVTITRHVTFLLYCAFRHVTYFLSGGDISSLRFMSVST
jgi:hypothetical protein